MEQESVGLRSRNTRRILLTRALTAASQARGIAAGHTTSASSSRGTGRSRSQTRYAKARRHCRLANRRSSSSNFPDSIHIRPVR